jgi:hypothetical protein
VRELVVRMSHMVTYNTGDRFSREEFIAQNVEMVGSPGERVRARQVRVKFGGVRCMGASLLGPIN